MQESDFDGCFAWWNDRTENTQAWKYNFKAAYDKAKLEAQPHWDAARTAEANANRNAKRVKELEMQIQNINASLLNSSPAKQQAKVKQQIQDLKDEQKQIQAEERQEREIAKQEQAKGDAIYWCIYNLDQKNPIAQNDFEHLPPEQLVADIWKKEQRILEILGEIKDVLQTKPSGKENL